MERQTVDHCIRHEGRYRNVGVYVVVVMGGGCGCPVEVQVSLAFDPLKWDINQSIIAGKFKDLEEIANAWLSCGGPLAGLIRFLNLPPCEMSGIIGDALTAALEG